MNEDSVLRLAPVVKSVARGIHRNLPCHIELEDLISAGWVGALQAVARYSGDRGVTLAQFAANRIRGAILDYLRQLDHLTRDHRRQVKRSGDVIPAPFALDAPTARAEGMQVADGTAVLSFQDVENREALRKLFAAAQLKPRHRSILETYYFRELTMKQVGRLFGVNESRVSQIISAALKQLRSTKPARHERRARGRDRGFRRRPEIHQLDIIAKRGPRQQLLSLSKQVRRRA